MERTVSASSTRRVIARDCSDMLHLYPATALSALRANTLRSLDDTGMLCRVRLNWVRLCLRRRTRLASALSS